MAGHQHGPRPTGRVALYNSLNTSGQLTAHRPAHSIKNACFTPVYKAHALCYVSHPHTHSVCVLYTHESERDMYNLRANAVVRTCRTVAQQQQGNNCTVRVWHSEPVALKQPHAEVRPAPGCLGLRQAAPPGYQPRPISQKKEQPEPSRTPSTRQVIIPLPACRARTRGSCLPVCRDPASPAGRLARQRLIENQPVTSPLLPSKTCSPVASAGLVNALRVAGLNSWRRHRLNGPSDAASLSLPRLRGDENRYTSALTH